MFGYIKIDKEELKVGEYNKFKAYYCGVCKAISRTYGFVSRMSLSYDAAFLALLFCSVFDDTTEIAPCACIANPLVKRPVACENPYIAYAADVNVLLTWFKLEDDWRDDRSLRALLLRWCIPKRKLKKRVGDLWDTVAAHLASLSRLEKAGCSVPDEAADAFGKVMEAAFLLPSAKEEATLRIFSHMGYLLGRFIYLLDAYADWERDQKTGAYNVYVQKYGDKTPDVRQAVADSLTYTLADLSHTYALLPLRQNGPILDNIIYRGLLRVLDCVLDGTWENQRIKGDKGHERPL